MHFIVTVDLFKNEEEGEPKTCHFVLCEFKLFDNQVATVGHFFLTHMSDGKLVPFCLQKLSTPVNITPLPTISIMCPENKPCFHFDSIKKSGKLTFILDLCLFIIKFVLSNMSNE